MPLIVEILGRPPSAPEPGSVSIVIKISGIDSAHGNELGDAFKDLTLSLAWGPDHEPHFYLYVPLTISEAGASLTCQLFLKHFVPKYASLVAIGYSVSIVYRWYGTCYYQCGTRFWGDQSEPAYERPEGWTLVTCRGCKRVLGCACPNCSTKHKCVERCDPPCRQCQSLPPETPASPASDQGS